MEGDQGIQNAYADYPSCTILTREASESVMPIHNRMPVIIKSEAYGPWLNPANQDGDALQEILKSQVHSELISYQVSKAVNSVTNNRPELIRPMEEPQ